jgi:hypothetical protein
MLPRQYHSNGGRGSGEASCATVIHRAQFYEGQDAGATEYALSPVAHFYEVTWMDTLKRLRARGEVLLEIGKTIRECPNHYNRDFALAQILLLSKIRVKCD